ncbi:MAG: RCC1 repeat-containing protein, partial [Microbacteriaceae bacterium]|nr:RCC1 repeat-containing protein [Microbacteriaceae bacterium]
VAHINGLEVAGGYVHSCARHSNSVSCWGAGSGGQLGNGLLTSSSFPVYVQGLTGAVELAVGWSHSCARLSNGGLRCWGGNGVGQLGDGTTQTPRGAPVAVLDIGQASQLAAGEFVTCARIGTTSVYCWGSDQYGQLGNGGTNTSSATPVQVTSLVAPTAIGSGPNSRHVCAVDGFAVRCWGRNDFGQVGDGTTMDRGSPIAVAFP